LPELLRRVGDDLHVLAEQHHGVHGDSDWSGTEAEETSEIDHHHDLTVVVADKATNSAEDVLTFDRTENVAPNEISDPNRLWEPHGVGRGQAHARRWRHTPGRGALCMDRVLGSGQQAHTKQNPECRRACHRPANQGKPFSSQYPPGYVFVTSMAVIHLGFLYPSLVAMRRRTG
jgi:hypothetical protein